MAATSGGRHYFGFSAYRALSWKLPVFWPLLPLLYLPGARLIGDAVYRRIAERRQGICRIDPAHAARRKQNEPVVKVSRCEWRFWRGRSIRCIDTAVSSGMSTISCDACSPVMSASR